jgi:hypothetical protein
MFEFLNKSAGPPQLHEACFVLLMINLNDLLMKAKKDGRSVSFCDHIESSEKVIDITDLVSKMRNAVCHVNSPLRNVGPAPFSFNRFIGEGYADNDGITLGCEFPDDVAIYYGQYRIYLQRHIGRAIRELSVNQPVGRS